MIRPTPEELELHAAKIGLPPVEAQKFFHYYESNGWMVGKTKMKQWRSAMAHWKIVWEQRRGHQQLNTTTQAILHQKELETVQYKMKTIRDSYADHQTWSNIDFAHFMELKARKVELKKLLGMQV